MADIVKTPSGFIVSQESGLVIPRPRNSYSRSFHQGANHPLAHMPDSNSTTSMKETPRGVMLDFDQDTMIMKVPVYGHPWGDYLLQAITRGTIANGFDQLPDPLLATAITKRQAIVGNWEVLVTGRKSPAAATLNIFSMAEDGEGAMAFSQNFIGALDVNNAGAFITTLPLHYDVSTWKDFGVKLVPIGQKDDNVYVIEVDKRDYLNNRGLWTIDRMQCEPTGNPRYPFWLYKTDNEGKFYRILIPKPYGIQRIQRVGPKSDRWAGYGQSGTWRFLPYVVRHFLTTRGDFERMIAKPPMGILAATGVDHVGQFQQGMRDYVNDQATKDQKVYPGVLFMEFEEPQAKIFSVPWYNPPEGYTPSTWYNLRVECLAASFHMSPNQFQMRLGDGARSQGDAVADIEERVTMAWLLRQVNSIYQEIALPRVVVTVINPSSQEKMQQAETASKLGDAIMKVEQSRGRDEGGETIFTVAEVRNLFEAYVGIPVDSEAEETYNRARVDSVEEEGLSDKQGPMTLAEMADVMYEETPLPFLKGVKGEMFVAKLLERKDLTSFFVLGLDDLQGMARYKKAINVTEAEARELGLRFATIMLTADRKGDVKGLGLLATRAAIYAEMNEEARGIGKIRRG